MYPYEGAYSRSICACLRCAIRLRMLEQSGRSLELRAYCVVRRNIVDAARLLGPTISRPDFVRETRRRNNRRASQHWQDQREWDENDTNDGAFPEGDHGYSDKQIGFEREPWVVNYWPA